MRCFNISYAANEKYYPKIIIPVKLFLISGSVQNDGHTDKQTADKDDLKSVFKQFREGMKKYKLLIER